APASIDNGSRSSVREGILSVQRQFPDRLEVLSYSLATEIIIEGIRAVGIRYLDGAHLYATSALAAQGAASAPVGETRVRQRGEVILAGGTFNTPQLLMLSGVGPAADLRKLGISLKCNLPGVGQNLQDRYEIGLACELEKDFTVLKGSKFEASDGD